MTKLRKSDGILTPVAIEEDDRKIKAKGYFEKSML